MVKLHKNTLLFYVRILLNVAINVEMKVLHAKLPSGGPASIAFRIYTISTATVMATSDHLA